MRKNHKGFTLIELLAAVVILGVLAIFAIPRIVNMVSDSKDKIYISDAKKLIAKADYKIRSASSDIEKPNPGECIVVSLVYLDSDEFESPPNEGKYEKEASYVVIKNDNSQMEYSATIIEKTKNGEYRGIELTKENVLSSRSAHRRVKTFQKADLVYVEDTHMTVDYINQKLGDHYVTEIDHVYNTPDLADSSIQDNSSSPKIMKASLSSTSGKSYNSLDATLTLRVDDSDTPRNRLTVYTSLTGYDDATSGTGTNYGDNNTFTKTFDFNDGHHSYNGETIQIFVVVKDDKENVAKKTLEYQLHTNEAPEINLSNSGLSRRDNENYNNTIAKLRLSISDDINTADELSVCFAEGSGATCSDSEYVTYASYFGDTDSKDYAFQCGSGCTLNGSTVTLNAFVKDTSGKVSSADFQYTFHNNAAPQYEYVSGTDYVAVESVTTGYHNLSVNVSVSFTDDITPNDQVIVHLSDGVNTKNTHYDLYNPIPFTFAGTYDGEERTLTVTLEDSMGAVSNPKTAKYVVHEDLAPAISSFTVTSLGIACENEALCPIELGGGGHVVLRLEAADDINSNDDVLACLSESPDVCVASNPSAFTETYGMSFRYYEKVYDFALDETHPYDGTNRVRNLYVGLMDAAGHVSTTSATYQLYKNQAPSIESFNVASNPENSIEEGNLNTYIQLVAEDDFGESDTVELKITQDDTLKVTSTLANYNRQNIDFVVDGNYDGSTKHIVITLTDSYGETSTAFVDYQLYMDQAPSINGINISSIGTACSHNVDLCPSMIGGTVDVKITLGVIDDVTNQEDLLVCFNEDPNQCDESHASNYVPYSQNEYDYTFTTTGSFPYYNQPSAEKTLYVFAKDNKGNIGTESESYWIYKDRPPFIRGVIGWDTNPRVLSRNPDGNGLDIHFDIDARDDFDSDGDIKVRVCYKKGNSDTESCLNNYVTYNPNGYDFTLPGSLDGSIYHIYARVRDSRNVTETTETITSIVDYQVVNDETPVIKAFKAAKDENGRVLVEVLVTDPLDTYKVCVGLTACTNYITQDINGETFSGSSGKTYTIEYPDPSELTDDTVSLTLKVADSSNHTATKTTLYDKDYTVCTNPINTNPIYEYTFDPDRTYTDPQGNPVTNNSKISAEKCGGRCYYWVKNNSASAPMNTNCPTNNIFGYYTKTTYYRDAILNSYRCLHPETNPSRTTYQATCGYIDCFYNPKQSNYNYIAIGMVPRSCPEWSVTIGGVTYTATTYYKSYTTSYNPGDSSVTLTEISRGAIHPAAIDAGLFNYDKNADVPYIRVLDN